MIAEQIHDIFKKGSKTYYSASLLFPKAIKEDVFILYAFVRTADNYVDAIPAQKPQFMSFKKRYYKALTGEKSNDTVIDLFVLLVQRKKIPHKWVDAFLQAMEQDLTKKKYMTFSETKQYMYGSAEVIGLMMAKIMDLPKESYTAAKLLGRAMQYINFIRDIEEDNQLGRQYIPSTQLNKYHLITLQAENIAEDKNFTLLIRNQVDIYRNWMHEARKGFAFLPFRYRLPIMTASLLYDWTANQIYRDPSIVFRRKVKPGISVIMTTMMRSFFT